MITDEHLNPEQRRAVESRSQVILVNAGAGTGKTTALTLRLIRVLKEGVSPWNVLALTFTRHAAGEMRRRIEETAGLQKKLTLSTFHAFAASLLERWGELLGYKKNFSIYDGSDQLEVIREILEEQALSLSPERMAREIQLGQFPHGHPLIREYHRRLKEGNAVDYRGLLTAANRLIKEYPVVRDPLRRRFTHLFVDELQDTDSDQWEMVHLLRPAHLFATGDDYQSIYRFRGARIDHILSFPKDFPSVEVIRLERNYRSTPSIVEAANRLIAHNRRQLEKRLWTDGSHSIRLSLLEADSPEKEAEAVSKMIRKHLMEGAYRPGQMAILYRTHRQAIPLGRALEERKIPHQVVTSSFWEREEIREIMAILTVLRNPQDDIHLKRILPKEVYPSEDVSAFMAEGARLERPLFEVLPSSWFKEHLLDLREKMTRGDYPTVLDLVREVDRRFQLSDRRRPESFPSEGPLLRKFYEIIARWQKERPEDHSLSPFLRWQATRSIQDELRDEEDSVKLLTVHAAKGLEWPVVFLCGLEQGLFPLRPALSSEAELEEERRLMYVAMTRAGERLYLLWARERERFGRRIRNRPSQFLDEMVRVFEGRTAGSKSS